MKLAFCFVIEYGNIFKQSFDFGSEYTYKAQIVYDELSVQRAINDKYISSLYKTHEKIGFENVTAIVGSNGSGKSIFMECLMLTLRNANNGRALLIFHDGDHTYMTTILPEVSGRQMRISTNFEYVNYGVHEYNHPRDTIFYSPIYDLRSFYNQGRGSVDISSNYLLREELRIDSNTSYIQYPSDLHNYGDVVRQLHFVNEYSQTDIISNNIKLPATIVMKIDEINLSEFYSSHWKEEIKKFFSTIDEKINQERQNVQSSEIDGIKQDFLTVPSSSKRTFYYLFLRSFWFYLLGFLNNIFESLITDYVKANDCSQMSLHEIIKTFFASQTKVDSMKVDDLLHTIRTILNDARVQAVNEQYDSSGLVISIVQAIEIEAAYRAYLLDVKKDKRFTRLQPFLTGDARLPFTFLKLDWGYTMSTGEKYFLNIYSRFHYAVNNILQAKKSIPEGENIRIAPHMYILIDEGEAGFHLQWQKEYVHNLITNLPNIMVFEDAAGQPFRPTLQLILTTHSPICLSDIPEYNVIYLKKNADGHCNVVDEGGRPRRSFGANIHDIIHDAFFLQNGFIGKFAQDKINEVFRWLTTEQLDNVLTPEYVKSLIMLVDEPIIKIKLRELYAHKMQLDVELERIKAQIETLNKRAEDIIRNKQP